MHLINFQRNGQTRTGALAGEWTVDLSRTLGVSPAVESLKQLFSAEEDVLDAIHRTVEGVIQADTDRVQELSLQGMILPLTDITILPPVIRPGKIICAGQNYPPCPDDGFRPVYPVLFHKVATSLTGHRTPIRIPRISREVEYEGELAVVIGKRCKYIQPDEAMSVIAGYTIANDVGARDLQRRSSQWTSGKMCDTFLPLGPVLATPDEIPDPGDLRIRTILNDTVVQDANTSEMIFGVFELVAYISSLTTLEPGDLILTGSPRRAGAEPDPRRFMRPGDVVRVEIKGIGMLENSVAEEEI